jgi:hypothetical protein
MLPLRPDPLLRKQLAKAGGKKKVSTNIQRNYIAAVYLTMNNIEEAKQKMQELMAARDTVRDLAVKNSTYEYDLHKMADRLDAIAKQIGIAALTLKG